MLTQNLAGLPSHISMGCRALLGKLLCGCLCFTLFYTSHSAAWSSERLRQRIEVHSAGEASGLTYFSVLLELYENWHYQFQWVNSQGALNKNGQILYAALNNAHYLGLDPNDYHLANITSLLGSAANDTQGLAIDLELLLSDALVLYLQHNYRGRVNAKQVYPEWFVDSETVALLPILREPITALRLEQILRASEPSSADYVRLKKYLRELIDRPQRGKISTAPLGRVYRLGDRDPLLKEVKSLLVQIDPHYTPDAEDTFDRGLQQQLQRFQALHNLKNDGVLGAVTYALLLQQFAGDIDTVRVNLERWRWMPRSQPTDYVSVNIPSFSLALIQGGQPTLTMEAIIGRSYRMTPVMEEQIRYAVVNPSWFVPHKIATIDLLPKIQRDPNYFHAIGMEVLRGVGSEQQVLDTAAIDWHSLSRDNFPYRLRQKPGVKNALGKVKFIFPNKNNVYLHDTNDPGLFSQSERSFSSGCIRVAKPIELLFALFQQHPTNSREKIQRLLDAGKEATLYLQQPLPIRIQYWTVWVDEQGGVQYRHDLYQRDKRILDALNSPLR